MFIIEVIFVICFILVIVVSCFVGYLVFCVRRARNATPYEKIEMRRLGRNLPQKRWVHFEEVPILFIKFLITAEDGGFLAHRGVEWSIFKKVFTAWRRHPFSYSGRGGSTITMQLVKNLCFSQFHRSIFRKVADLTLALILECMYSKRFILELYLNVIEYGEGVFGLYAAVQHYFQCEVKQIDMDKGLYLCCLLPAPKRFGKGMLSSFWFEQRQAILDHYQEVDIQSNCSESGEKDA